MGTRRYPYVFDAFRGEDNHSSLTNQAIFGATGAHAGRMRRLRNYHLIGPGKALSRRGYTAYVAALPNGVNAIQGMRMDEWGSTRDLYVVVGGQLRRLNGSSWDNVTGTATFTTGQDVHTRWTNFTDANQNWLIGCDGTAAPFIVRNGVNAALFSAVSPQPLPWLDAFQPVDMCEFHGYVLALNRHNLYYTAYGTLDFANGSVIDTQRRSLGVGLAQHSRDIVMVFFERGVYAMEFNPFEGSTFRAVPIEGAEGCVSKDSIYTRDGWTYWASHKGLYRVGDPRRGAQFVTEEIQDYWDSLNQERRYQIRHVERGSPWHEVIWLVSESGNSEHNAAIVFNDRIGACTIFPKSQSPDVMEFNAACLYRGSDLIDRTLVGGYDGVVYQAWGAANSGSGNSDNGSAISTEIETGFMNYGFPGVSDLREVFVDGEVSSSLTFQVQGETLGSAEVVNRTFTIGTAGAILGVFVIGTDYLVSSTVSQGNFEMPLSGRAHKLRISRSGTEAPHILTALTMTHLPKRLRPR